MCGIYASISTEGFRSPSKELQLLLCNRGPDHTGSLQSEAKNGDCSYFLSFTSTVLALRGGEVISQPFVDHNTGSALCWNGEAWKIGSTTIEGNDGQFVFDKLIRAVSAHGSTSSSTAAVLEVLNNIFGPFAFVFLDKPHKQLYFARDRLGRRSLLYNKTTSSIEFSSTSDPEIGDWKEIEADGVYVLSYSQKSDEDKRTAVECAVSSTALPIHRHDWVNNLDVNVSLPFVPKCL